MKFMQNPVFCVVFGIFTCLASCTKKSANKTFSTAAPSESANASKEFFSGIAAPSGSSQRKASGAMLKRWLADNTPTNKEASEIAEKLAKKGSETPQREKEVQSAYLRQMLITKSFLSLTADHMMGTTCDASQKVRLYRGIGKYQLRELNAAKFSTWSTWNAAALLDGQPIPADNPTKADAFADLQFKLKDQVVYGEPVQLMFDSLALNHSGSGSESSALISTSISWKVASAFSNPQMLVLDVCPERLIVAAPDLPTFPELEVYLPLVIFPEEITQIIEVNGPPETFSYSEASRNATTTAFRQIFLNRDLPFDESFVVSVALRMPNYGSANGSAQNVSDYFSRQSALREKTYDALSGLSESGVSLADARTKLLGAYLGIQGDSKLCQTTRDSYIEWAKQDKVRTQTEFLFGSGRNISKAVFSITESAQVHDWRAETLAKFKQAQAQGQTEAQEKLMDTLRKYTDYFDTEILQRIWNQNHYKDENYVKQCK